jgi:drug/metabolite transporter (DMT)-like permease
VSGILALLAAVCFAFGTVLQQKGALQTPAGGEDPRFLLQILRRPVWIAGGLLQGGGWVLQAAALDRGSLVVVQSICTLSLVFALPLGMRITHQHVGRREVGGAAAVVVGIVLFIAVAQSSAGTTTPSAAEWWIAGILMTSAIGILMGLGWSGTAGRQALLFGLAAGCAFAFQAAVTKVFVGQLHHGVGALLA